MVSPDATPAISSALKFITSPRETVSASKLKKERSRLRNEILGIAGELLERHGEDAPLLEGEKGTRRWTNPVQYSLDGIGVVELRLVQDRVHEDLPAYKEEVDTISTGMNIYQAGEFLSSRDLFNIEQITTISHGRVQDHISTRTTIGGYRNTIASIEEVREARTMIEEFTGQLEVQAASS